MIGWLRGSRRARSLKAFERRKRLVGFTTYGTVFAHEGFRNHQQITEEIFCALLRPSMHEWRQARPALTFEMEALPDGAMRVRAIDINKQVVAEHTESFDALLDYENRYDGGILRLRQRLREGVGA